MTAPGKTWWRNCALKADSEILAIDGMEDRIAPIATDASEIRGLISTLELCHHKADRWVTNIVEAIGAGKTGKGLGTRPATPCRARLARCVCRALGMGRRIENGKSNA